MIRLNKLAIDFVTATMLALGFAVLATIFYFAGAAWYTETVTVKRSYETFGVAAETGEPVITLYSARQRETLNLERQPISTPDELATNFLLPSNGNLWGSRTISNGNLPWGERITSLAFAKERWYFVRSGNGSTGYLVGYGRSAKRVGYIGATGFQDEQPNSDACFHLSPDLRHYHLSSTGPLIILATTEGIVRVELKERTVKTLAEITDVQSIGVAAAMIAFRTDTEVRLLDLDGNAIHACAVPPDTGDDTLTVWRYSNEGVLLDAQPTYEKHVLHWYEKTEEQDAATPIQPLRNQEVTLELPTADAEFLGGVSASALFPMVPWAFAFATKTFSSFAGFLWLLPLPLSTAVITWWTSSGSFRQRFAWAFFAFVLGVPGLLGYWSQKRKDRQLSCESCEQKIAKRRADCGHCGEMISVPARIGTEIFA